MKQLTLNILYKFLSDCGSLQQYLNYSNKTEVKERLKLYPKSIISVFEWTKTIEGFDYWCYIDYKWRYFLGNGCVIINRNNDLYKLFIRFLKENNIYAMYFKNKYIYFPYIPPNGFLNVLYNGDNFEAWNELKENWINLYRTFFK